MFNFITTPIRRWNDRRRVIRKIAALTAKLGFNTWRFESTVTSCCRCGAMISHFSFPLPFSNVHTFGCCSCGGWEASVENPICYERRSGMTLEEMLEFLKSGIDPYTQVIKEIESAEREKRRLLDCVDSVDRRLQEARTKQMRLELEAGSSYRKPPLLPRGH